MEFEKIRDIIAEQMNVSADKITMKTTFTDLGADSLDVFQIITEVEEVFGVEFTDEAAQSFKTVGDAVAFLQKSNEA